MLTHESAGIVTVAAFAAFEASVPNPATEKIDHYVMAITLPERVACDDPLRSHTGSWMEVCDALDAYDGRPDLVEHVERLG
jgi:hypothetical protein